MFPPWQSIYFDRVKSHFLSCTERLLSFNWKNQNKFFLEWTKHSNFLIFIVLIVLHQSLPVSHSALWSHKCGCQQHSGVTLPPKILTSESELLFSLRDSQIVSPSVEKSSRIIFIKSGTAYFSQVKNLPNSISFIQ